MTQPPRAEGPRGAKPSSLAEAAASAHPQSRRATTGLKALRCCCCAPPLLLTAAYRRVSGARGAAEEAPGKRRAPAQGRAGEDGPPRGPGPATVPAHHMPAVPGSIAAVSGFSGPGSGPSPSAAAPARHAAVVCGWSHS
ncbi:tetra-peptide repeat homeobox protein 1-like [Tupaia chinensis]|uniref:tetra-peptide repeat homeobox protein 1-like n=1 Tax=Tupaia chinensis TaxID=246437 RepID=UPI0003C920D6|nr:tetra-peptide repeat homeobox protein 1-like [Tupaia chinensis]